MALSEQYFETIQGGTIDRGNCVISGVCAITANVAAKGHGVFTDSQTIQTALEVAKSFPNGVKVKFRHKMDGEYQSVIDESAGVLKNFRIEGDKLKGDLHLLKSLDANRKEKIFELAEVMPDQFGLSIVFVGGSEEIGGKKYLRCEDLLSIDLADNPAANPDGLFESKKTTMSKIKYKSGDSGAHHEECMCGECSGEKHSKKMEAFEQLVASLQAEIKSLKEKPVTLLSYKDAEDKEVSLSVSDVASKLAAADAAIAAAKQSAEATAKDALIKQIKLEGRVVKDPKTGKAYTAAELPTLSLEFLQFASVNAPALPLEAKAVYNEKTGKEIDPKLKGSERMVAAFEAAGYDNARALQDAPVGTAIKI